MKHDVIKLTIGALGIGASEIAATTQGISPDEIGVIGNLVIQIVIGIATIFGIFKKRKQ